LLRDYLRQQLPAYMVPSLFMPLAALPLTINGKIDRKALPACSVDRPELGQAYVAPRSEVESALASIVAEVLGIARVGVHDDFFALGGHSLLATQVVSRIRSKLAVTLPLRELFQAPTVAQIAPLVESLLWSEVSGQVSGTVAPSGPVEDIEDGEL
jgi:acyl carrier protein